jgi:hypothetical protein
MLSLRLIVCLVGTLTAGLSLGTSPGWSQAAATESAEAPARIGTGTVAPGTTNAQGQVAEANPSEATPEATNADARTVRKLVTNAPSRPKIDGSSNHPLTPVLKMAADGYRQVRRDVKDYTCVMVRRERIDGVMRPHEFIYAKVRHRSGEGENAVPFGVYLKFLKPSDVAGREILYVEGRNNGEMFARRGGTRFEFVTTRLDPHGELAMRNNRYPITEFGIQQLLARLVENARRDLQTHCDVQMLPNASIGDRPAHGVVVTHRSPDENADYSQARIYVDKELQLPIHFESYGWPEQPGEERPLQEQYTYMQLKLNVGLTDADFSEENPEYRVK